MSARLTSDEPSIQTREWGIAILRLAIGLTFFMHGWQKLFEFGIAGVAGAFAQMGVPLPAVSGPLVSVLELVGGAAIVLGLGTRWIAIPLAIDMLVAILLVHLPSGFFAPNGAELPLLLLAGVVALVLTGPGAYALDGVIVRTERRPRSGDQRVASSWQR